jgi:hypothetical protein
VAIKYSERLAEAGIEPSVGSKGDSYDNALAETINGLYKAELIHRRAPWKTREAVELATLEWVSWFNHHRLLAPLGYIPPAEAEANYYKQLSSQAAYASLCNSQNLGYDIRGPHHRERLGVSFGMASVPRFNRRRGFRAMISGCFLVVQSKHHASAPCRLRSVPGAR